MSDNTKYVIKCDDLYLTANKTTTKYLSEAIIFDSYFDAMCVRDKLKDSEMFMIVVLSDNLNAQPQKYSRPSWEDTWMTVARTMANRSYDPRLKVGAIIVSEDNTSVLSIGYNGNYKGGPHEHESQVPGKSGFIHAEVNALVKFDYNFPKNKHMYVTHSPCRDCSKLIINAGISRVIYDKDYRDKSGLELLRNAGVDVVKYEDNIYNEG